MQVSKSPMLQVNFNSYFFKFFSNVVLVCIPWAKSFGVSATQGFPSFFQMALFSMNAM